MSRFDLTRFKPPPDDEFICGICKNVLDDPKESPCRHVFCKGCIIRALQETPKCPLCRKAFRERHLKNVLPLVQNLLNKLPMQCDYADNGCEAQITLEVYPAHIKDCGYMMVTCKNASCNKSLLRMDIEHHMSNECQCRTFMCGNGCQCDVVFADKEKHNCLETLLTIRKESMEKIEKLEQRVKELESIILLSNTKSGNVSHNHTLTDRHNSDDDDDYNASLNRNSPLYGSDIGSLSNSPHSFHSYDNYNYSISSSDIDEPFDIDTSIPSPFAGSDCSDDYRDVFEAVSGSYSDRNIASDDEMRSDADFRIRVLGRSPAMSRGSDIDNNSAAGGASDDGGDGSDSNIDRFLDALSVMGTSSILNKPVTRQVSLPELLRNSVSQQNTRANNSDILLSQSDSSSVDNNNRNNDDGSDNDNHEEFGFGAASWAVVGRGQEDLPSSSAGPETRSDQSGLSRKRAGQAGCSTDGPTAKKVRLIAYGPTTDETSSPSNLSNVNEDVNNNNNNDNNNNNNDDYNNNDSTMPLRRSARLRNIPAGPVDDDNLVPVPPPASYLLDLYSNEDSGSSDESWTPPLHA